jgi:enoyl-CoA hydratase/carnithine racemase
MFRLDHEGDVARLTLDRPQARNAIPASGWAEFAALLDKVDARLLVVRGAGGAFCAGADLGDFTMLRDDAAARLRFREDMRAALEALRKLTMPTVAYVEGACYGAGVALAIACDLRVAGADARFAVTPARIGLSYPQEDVYRLVTLIGPGQAARLLFTAAAVGADEALRIGLAELAELDEQALLANDADSLATLKRAIGLAADGARSDGEQDRRFDALVAGDALAARLEALRRK